MRRVYDDTHYEKVKDELIETLELLRDCPWIVSEQDRIRVHMIRNYIENTHNIKFGRTYHAHNIGNNNAIELIVETDYNEEQICGLLHLTDDMYGRVYAYITDIDGERKYPNESVFIAR